MKPLEQRDYFTDYEILKDPYAYFEAVRAKGPVYQLPETGLVVVTGYEETVEVLNNTRDFSAVINVGGPVAPMPFEPKGSDITAQIEENRSKFVGGDLLVARDDAPHTASRALLNRLFTPVRVKANQEFIAQYSEKIVAESVAKGSCELMKTIATPFVTMVIADLLGVPPDERQLFMDAIEANAPPGSLNKEHLATQQQAMEFRARYFAQYVMKRRAQPQEDILSELSNATYPDGSTPEVAEIVRLSTFLFGAGQDTSAKLLGNAMRFIVDHPGLQEQLRADPSLIPALIEEVLRLEGSTKMTARMARKDTEIKGFKVPAGTRVMLALAAANRDPRRWENPNEFILNRPRAREHVAFGRGVHVCAGALLARFEVKDILEKFIEHTSHIDLDEEKHGPKGNRSFDFEPTFIIRGLQELHVKLTPAGKPA